MKRNKRILEEYKKHTRIRELSEIYDISNERVRKIILKQMSREEYWKIKQDRHERTVKELKAKYYNRYHTDEEYRKKIIESVKKNQNKK